MQYILRYRGSFALGSEWGHQALPCVCIADRRCRKAAVFHSKALFPILCHMIILCMRCPYLRQQRSNHTLLKNWQHLMAKAWLQRDIDGERERDGAAHYKRVGGWMETHAVTSLSVDTGWSTVWPAAMLKRTATQGADFSSVASLVLFATSINLIPTLAVSILSYIQGGIKRPAESRTWTTESWTQHFTHSPVKNHNAAGTMTFQGFGLIFWGHTSHCLSSYQLAAFLVPLCLM